MARAMAEHGLPIPRFDELGGEFRVTLVGPGERFMQTAAPAPVWTQGLNERQIKVMGYVAKQGKITNREYQSLFGVARATALLDLNDLVARGLLGAEGAGRGKLYVLAMAQND
jgi:ATP-dependent DNA helicase RecG